MFDFTPNYFQFLSGDEGAYKFGFNFGLETYTDAWERTWIKGNGVQVSIIDAEYMSNEYTGFRLGVFKYGDTSYKSNIKYTKTTNTLFWYNRQSADYQYNKEGATYYWIIF